MGIATEKAEEATVGSTWASATDGGADLPPGMAGGSWAGACNCLLPSGGMSPVQVNFESQPWEPYICNLMVSSICGSQRTSHYYTFTLSLKVDLMPSIVLGAEKKRAKASHKELDLVVKLQLPFKGRIWSTSTPGQCGPTGGPVDHKKPLCWAHNCYSVLGSLGTQPSRPSDGSCII